MKRSVFFKFAASSFILGATMAGCATTSPGNRGTAALDVDQTGKPAKTVTLAEAAVDASPNDGHLRAMLGKAYLDAGRFASAETSFEDALSLGQNDAQTVIGLAMSRIAGGRSDAARDLLQQNADVLPAADYGLAMALAGDTDEGLRVLWAQARQPNATAQVRQNLAYALAMAGRWKESKLVASQDISPTDAAKRVTQWALLARPGAQAEQVAQLIGVTPKADPGFPVALALKASSDPAPVETAAAPELVPPGYSSETGTEIENFSEVASFAERAQPALPMIQPLSPPGFVAPIRKKASYIPAGGYAVQIGAFSSAAGVDQAWRNLSSRYQNIRAFTSIVNHTQVAGRTFHRLALSGFDNRAEAERLCASLKAKGSVCFVRRIDVAAATQWVSRDVRQLASRGT